MTTHNNVQRDFAERAESIGLVPDTLGEPIKAVGTLSWCGNGSSAAHNQPLVAELGWRFEEVRRALGSTVPSDTTAQIQEAHILIGRTLCDLQEFALE